MPPKSHRKASAKASARRSASSPRGSKKASDPLAELRLTGKLPKGVSTEAATSVLEVFQRFDSDRNGSITRQELAIVLQALDATTWTDDRLDRLFGSMDVNRDERLNLGEFITWIFSEGGLQPEFKEVADRISGIDAIAIRVFALDGSELAVVHVPPTASVHALKVSLSTEVMVPVEEQAILFKDEVLADKRTLFHVGIDAEGFVNFMRVPRVRSEKAREKHIQSLCEKIEKDYHDLLKAREKVNLCWFSERAVRKELCDELDAKNQEIQDCLEKQKTELESFAVDRPTGPAIGVEHELEEVLPQLIQQCDQIRAELSSGSRKIEFVVPRADGGAKEQNLFQLLQSEEEQRRRRAARDADISTVADLWRRIQTLCIPLENAEKEFVKSLMLPGDLDPGTPYGHRCQAGVRDLYCMHCEYGLVCRFEEITHQRIRQVEAELLSCDVLKGMMDKFLSAIQVMRRSSKLLDSKASIPEQLNKVVALRDSLVNDCNTEIGKTRALICQMLEANESMLAENAEGISSFNKIMSSWHKIMMGTKERARERGDDEPFVCF